MILYGRIEDGTKIKTSKYGTITVTYDNYPKELNAIPLRPRQIEAVIEETGEIITITPHDDCWEEIEVHGEMTIP